MLQLIAAVQKEPKVWAEKATATERAKIWSRLGKPLGLTGEYIFHRLVCTSLAVSIPLFITYAYCCARSRRDGGVILVGRGTARSRPQTPKIRKCGEVGGGQGAGHRDGIHTRGATTRMRQSCGP